MDATATARAAGHPRPLHIAPESTRELAKDFGTPLWAVGIESPDGSFGHVSVLLVHRGTFLTPSLEPSLGGGRRGAGRGGEGDQGGPAGTDRARAR